MTFFIPCCLWVYRNGSGWVGKLLRNLKLEVRTRSSGRRRSKYVSTSTYPHSIQWSRFVVLCQEEQDLIFFSPVFGMMHARGSFGMIKSLKALFPPSLRLKFLLVEKHGQNRLPSDLVYLLCCSNEMRRDLGLWPEFDTILRTAVDTAFIVPRARRTHSYAMLACLALFHSLE